MAKVRFHPGGQVVDVPQEVSLLDAATLAGATAVSCCGITAACGRCRALVLSGETNLAAPGALEAGELRRQRFLPGERFGCMTQVLGDVEVELSE